MTATANYPNQTQSVPARRATSTVRDFTESKNGFKTTEFLMTGLFVIGVLLATYLDGDSLSRSDGWLYASFAVIAYSVSRGLAKLGVREPYTKDTESDVYAQ